MRISEQEKQEAKARLLEWVKPGDTVYTSLRHVSASGMTRVIEVIVFSQEKDGRLTDWHIGYNVAKAMGFTYDRDRNGIKISGCGMDMGYSIVYDLSHLLFGSGQEYSLKHSWL